MSSQITIEGKVRTSTGKNESRRLRAGGDVPVTVYGHGEPVAAAINRRHLAAIFRAESGHNTIFNLQLDNGDAPAVIIKEWAIDPIKGSLLHADLFRLKLDEVMRVRVPLHTTGTPLGVKLDAGILELSAHEIEIECLPGDIPEHISLDVSGMRLNSHISVGDLKLGDKIKVLSDSAMVLAAVHGAKAGVEEAAAPVATLAAEPEVIKKGKPEETK